MQAKDHEHECSHDSPPELHHYIPFNKMMSTLFMVSSNNFIKIIDDLNYYLMIIWKLWWNAFYTILWFLNKVCRTLLFFFFFFHLAKSITESIMSSCCFSLYYWLHSIGTKPTNKWTFFLHQNHFKIISKSIESC